MRGLVGIAVVGVTLASGTMLGRWLDPTIGWRGTPAWCLPPQGESSPRSKAAATRLFPFRAVDQKRRVVSAEGLRGSLVIADTIFTRCRGVCPLLSAHMVWLQRQLPGEAIRFLSFSVDPEHDDQQALAQYATRWGGDDRWSLLATDRRTLSDVADGLGLGVPGLSQPGALFHSDRFALVDAEGSVRGVYDLSEPAALKRLAADARTLLRSPTAAPAATDAAGLLAALGCAGCHGDPRTGPSLSALGGSLVPLAGGAYVTADVDYLRRAILEPSAQIVAGYDSTMPNYSGRLTDAELKDLVTYLMRGT